MLVVRLRGIRVFPLKFGRFLAASAHGTTLAIGAKGMNPEHDSMDQQLLNLIQTEVPVVERPFAALGEKLGTSEADVIERIHRLKTDKIIRQISAIFDTRSLGYASSLVACKCDPRHEDEAAAIIGQHPGVSHNYKRNHEFNLWYTIAVPPTSRLGLEKTVETLHKESGAESTRLLPTLKLFKIGVQFDVTGEGKVDDQAAPKYTEKNRSEQTPVTPREIEFIRVMQRNLPLTPTPFVEYAKEIGLSLPELQEMHARFLQQGKMRRFSAVLNHRKVGFAANAMGVWAVRAEDAEVERIGEMMGSFRAVSHCYKRPTYPDWPYNIFTMVHGKSSGECEQVLKAISEKTGVKEYSALYSTKEYKKIRVRYFTREEGEWEAKRA
jgi:DNA-binding Lrp family transcriptional regulator